jgi:hypothetical protein
MVLGELSYKDGDGEDVVLAPGDCLLKVHTDTVQVGYRAWPIEHGAPIDCVVGYGKNCDMPVAKDGYKPFKFTLWVDFETIDGHQFQLTVDSVNLQKRMTSVIRRESVHACERVQ